LKKITALFTILLLLLSMTACAGEVSPNTDDTLNVVVTIFPQYDFVRALAGERIGEVKMLIKPGAESHDFDPSPADIIAIKNSDLFIYVGGESESWVDTILSGEDMKNVKTVRMMDFIDVIREETVAGMESEHHGGEEDDEHIWTSPKNAKLISKAIAEALSQADPANAEFFESKLDDYLQQLDILDGKFEEISEKAIRPIVIGDRFPFGYLAEEYGFEYRAAFPGCSSKSEASAATIAYLIDFVKEKDVPTVFYLELSTGNISRTIAQATGADTMLLHSCHNVTADEMKNGETYLSLMTKNAAALEKALCS